MSLPAEFAAGYRAEHEAGVVFRALAELKCDTCGGEIAERRLFTLTGREIACVKCRRIYTKGRPGWQTRWGRPGRRKP